KPGLNELEVLGRVVHPGIDRTVQQIEGPVGVRADRLDEYVLVRIEARALERGPRRDVTRAAGVRYADRLALEVRDSLDALLDVQLVGIHRREVRHDHEVGATAVRSGEDRERSHEDREGLGHVPTLSGVTESVDARTGIGSRRAG